MDYEKKYNEALERARALWREAIEKEYPNDYLKDYETIFPELAESEDERIRKDLIHDIQMLPNLGVLTHRPVSEYIAYLEKQKEQKQTDLPAGFYYIDLNGNRYYSKEFRYGDMKLKVGEQKPAWSEDIIRKAVKEIGLTQHQIDWFKTNVFPPKQEWSEEDKRNRDRAIFYTRFYQRNEGTTKGSEECIDWLKSLRPQPREEIYQSAKHDLAIKFMNYLDENRPEGKMSLSNGECEDIDKAFKENDWAKIMRYVEKYRPPFKPSEEQMTMLRAIINDPNNAGAESCHLVMKSLYEQLEKL